MFLSENSKTVPATYQMTFFKNLSEVISNLEEKYHLIVNEENLICGKRADTLFDIVT